MTEHKPRQSIGGSLRKAWRLLDEKDRRRFWLVCIVSSIQAFLELVGVGAVPAFVGALASPERVFNHATIGPMLKSVGITTHLELLTTSSVGLTCAFALKTIYSFFSSWVQARFLQGLRVRIGTRLFSAYMHTAYEFHLSRNSADLLRNTSQEIERMMLLVLAPVLGTLGQALIGACLIVLMLVVDPLVTLLGIGLFAGSSYAFLAVLRKRSMALGRGAQQHRAGLIQVINEGLGSFKEARVLGRETAFVQRYTHANYRLAQAVEHRQLTTRLIPIGLEFIAVLGLTAIVGLLLWTGKAAGDIVPLLALFAMALLRLRQVVSQVASTLNGLRYEHMTIDPIYDDLQLLGRDGAAEPRRRGHRRAFDQAIELVQVGYRYPGTEQWALRDISLRIPRGSSVALVGTTGAGKSTLADVLLGLLKPQHGEIRVDGDIIHSDLHSWQSLLGYIPQSLYLLDDSVRANIAFGVPKDAIDDNRVAEVVRIAQLETVVAGLPEGLDTLLGDRGVRISGGQRQRICIARALYHDPEILILDEATSALDSETEGRIVEELDAQRGGRTLIIIAHRLSTVRNCDKLFLLRDGQIEAEGTYDELVHHNQRFKALTAADG